MASILFAFVLRPDENECSNGGKEEKNQAKDVWNDSKRVLDFVFSDFKHELLVDSDHRDSSLQKWSKFGKNRLTDSSEKNNSARSVNRENLRSDSRANEWKQKGKETTHQLQTEQDHENET